MILQHLQYGSTYTAIEHTFYDDKTYFHLLKLGFKKKTLNIDGYLELDSQNVILDHLKKGQHISVVINHQKVISKTIEGLFDVNKAVSIAFPNIKLSDFYVEILTQKEDSIVSICRKTDVDQILKFYSENAISVISFSLGISSFETISPFLNDGIYSTGNSDVTIENGAITACEKTTISNSSNYIVNGLELSSGGLIPFAKILTSFNSHKHPVNNFEDKLQQLKNTFNQTRIFKLSLQFCLGFLMVMLFINFSLFSTYRTDVSNLGSELEINKTYKTTMINMEHEVALKRKLVGELTATKASMVPLYLDKIGSSIPNSMILDQMYFQPLSKSIKAFKEIQIENNVITIKGVCSIEKEFTTWVDKLSQLKWVSKVTVIDFGVGSKSKTSFEIKIALAA